MPILQVQNKKEEKFLRQPARSFDFSKFNKKQIQELIANMRRIMKSVKGVGLSANQIGLDTRVFVAELPTAEGRSKFYAVFNPILEKISENKITIEEGCLSVPKTYGAVNRAEKVVLNGFDKNGKKIKIKAWGFLARIFQHEIDHLNGILFIDKARGIKKSEV